MLSSVIEIEEFSISRTFINLFVTNEQKSRRNVNWLLVDIKFHDRLKIENILVNLVLLLAKRVLFYNTLSKSSHFIQKVAVKFLYISEVNVMSPVETFKASF